MKSLLLRIVGSRRGSDQKAGGDTTGGESGHANTAVGGDPTKNCWG